jgi:antitoxin VapB
MKKAKIFRNGRSQAVRIPREYRFNSKEVAITPLGKGIVIQPILYSWKEVFEAITATRDFLPEGVEDVKTDQRDWEAFK